MHEVVVRELWTYPVKSCQGVSVASIDITTRGITGDRCFAIWSDGELLEQKLTPEVAAIAAALVGDETLRLSHENHGRFDHHLRVDGPLRPTRWLLDEFHTIDQGDEAAAWLSAVLGRSVRLVSPHEPWPINLPFPPLALLHQQEKLGFTSASPVGLANQASLDDLNGRLASPVPMDRFRVNIVVDGLDPYQEDDLISLSHGEVELRHVTTAERCVIITTDQCTGLRPASDIMQTLASYRKKPKADRFASGLMFGTYLTVEGEGSLRVGDPLTFSQA